MAMEEASLRNGHAFPARMSHPTEDSSGHLRPGIQRGPSVIPEDSEPNSRLPSPSGSFHSGSAGQSALTSLLRTSPPNERVKSAPLDDASSDRSVPSINISRADTMPRESQLTMASSHGSSDLIVKSPDPIDENSPLLRPMSSSKPSMDRRPSTPEEVPTYFTMPPPSLPDMEDGSWRHRAQGRLQTWAHTGRNHAEEALRRARKVNRRDVWKHGVLRPASNLPAVVLGLLLNVLDALSYGMILFPLGTPLFSKMGPDGISMFYVSCVVSQLVYSLGGSVFKGGVGSEMIEVVPFFHQMAFTIMTEIGEDNPKSVIATTILSFSLSSIVTGLVFFALGAARLGSLIGFFPRHILVGCIGGVGWFLIVTGVEVSARLDGNLTYTLDTAKQLLEAHTLALWATPLLLAIVLIGLQHLFRHHAMVVPAYFISVPMVFYIVVAAVPNLNMADLRGQGWVFDAVDSDMPWWNFYTYYSIEATNWGALAKTFPAMLALTFFGILHVPINVPALGVSTGEDNVDVDRELKAHGVSNALSGMMGSIQNYLVYTNSVLFIRTGGNSRLAGAMLAFATAGIMFIGPSIIGYIPVMVVGALIFLLGIDLVKEALVDTWGKLHPFEYFTIMAIIFSMAAWDFVFGILVGIILACITFVVQTSRKSAIRTTYTGAVARSTVRRHPTQQKFLKQVGDQIHVCKLSGYMFFGTISRVERSIRDLVDTRNFTRRPIRYLIVDFTLIYGIDFSAADAFTRLRRLLGAKEVHLILCGIRENGEIARALKQVDMWADEEGWVQVFEDLNSALESCENELLQAFYQAQRAALHADNKAIERLDVPDQRSQPKSQMAGFDAIANSPRRNFLQQTASSTLKEEVNERGHVALGMYTKFRNFKQPLPLLLQIFGEFTNKGEDFWFGLSKSFKRVELPQGTIVWKQGEDADCFYLIESGILRATYDFEHGEALLSESIVAGTVCGELPFLSETPRTATVVAERSSVVWKMDRSAWTTLQEDKVVMSEMLKIGMKLTSERISAITSYVLTTAK
ncbi:hypothetical protein SAICODRAFT_74248 [Saitoella complicata NRRL Y-17804]|nr:uncharacterized protein SAICODRAFT_74248 [Saitoella complicata NRRL Y-17804]ODQ56026.1 hypothetical protein SAICODRAFT_74248 [Saitoella complicata NRRL Y-17804]